MCGEANPLDIRQKWWNPLLCTRGEAKLRGCDFSKTPGLPMRGRRAALFWYRSRFPTGPSHVRVPSAGDAPALYEVFGLRGPHWTVRAAFGRRSDVRGPRY